MWVSSSSGETGEIMPAVFVSIGSNIDPERNIPSSLKHLEERFGRLTASSIYANPPVGFQGPCFYNLVVKFHTELSVDSVSLYLAEIEMRHDRTRAGGKFSSHTIDLDLLLYGDSILHEGKLRLPREDITRYAFVLEPLAEIAPDEKHPITGKTYQELWLAFDKTDWRPQRISLKE
jgi:2-amino-4-hydroxy-6-hydroxymethyldihydropteridine diphosphokinase